MMKPTYPADQILDDGNCVVHVRAQVMMRDDSTGGWLPLGGGGMSNVSVRKTRKLHQVVDEPCNHEYIIFGKRATDQTQKDTEDEGNNPVILNCAIKKDFEYHRVMPTFHHWRFGDVKFGLTFQTAADARAFDRAVRVAIEDLLEDKSVGCSHFIYKTNLKGLSETSPLHQTNLEIGEDDVFMQLDLPMEKPLESRLRSSKSTTPPKPPHGQGGGVGHSPSPELNPMGRQHPKLSSRRGHGGHAPIAMSKSVSPPKATPSLPRYLTATHSDATPTSHTHQSTLNSSVMTSNDLPPPVPPCPAPRPQLTHSRVPPVGHPVGVISHQPSIPMALTSTEKSKLLPDLKDLADLGGPGLDHRQSGPNLSDKDCSYVKFPRRIDPSHEYSYPKLIDAYKPSDSPLSRDQVAHVTAGSATPTKVATPPCPRPSFGPAGSGSGGGKSGVSATVAATFSSNSSGSSKKSRRSLPSLVLSCGGGRAGERAGRSGGTATPSAQPTFCGEGVASESSHAHFDSSLSPERDSSESNLSHLCIHCRKSYNPGVNIKGACRYAPNDWARTGVETVTCLSCARCLLYHCISDPDLDEDIHDPCECTSGPTAHGVRRWLGLTLLSILVPCLCCYPPLMACYKGAAACGLCGGRHEASKGQLS